MLRGDPGAGKTTLMRHMAADLAREALRDDAGDAPWVPILCSLPRLVREPEELFARLARRLRKANQPAKALPAVLEKARDDGRLLLLLDGLDEVPRELREEAEQLVRDYSALWRDSPIVVATRPIGYHRPAEIFRELDVQPLDAARRLELLARWLRDSPGDPPAWPAARAAKRLFDDDRGLRELSENPLYLALMALLHKSGVTPSSNRSRLYDQVFDLLLEGKHRPSDAPMDAKEATREVLRYLAEGMTRDNVDAEPVGTLESRLLREEAEPILAPIYRISRWHHRPRAFLDDLAARTGILGPHDGPEEPWKFWHRTFREALAAEALADRHRAGGDDALIAHVRAVKGDESRWAEPYALLAGHVSEPDELVRTLVRANPALGHRALATALGVDEATIDEILGLTRDLDEREKVFARIPELVGDPERALTLLERLRRRTTDGRDLYHVREAIEAIAERWPKHRQGAERHRDRLFDHLEAPDPRLFGEIETRDGVLHLWKDLPEPGLRVAIVTVTNAQDASFDPGKDPRRWKGMPDGEPASHPRVEVDWYEAVSFCRWLAEHEGFEGARLPSEEEWEAACRAGTTTSWSFGDEKAALDEHCWYDRNSGGRTHRVGRRLPNPWGLYDVHGNVWEWCTDTTRGDNRVIRGGSYWDTADGTRSAFRYIGHPADRIDGQGFRVVLPLAPGPDV